MRFWILLLLAASGAAIGVVLYALDKFPSFSTNHRAPPRVAGFDNVVVRPENQPPDPETEAGRLIWVARQMLDDDGPYTLDTSNGIARTDHERVLYLSLTDRGKITARVLHGEEQIRRAVIDRFGESFWHAVRIHLDRDSGDLMPVVTEGTDGSLRGLTLRIRHEELLPKERHS